MAKRSPETPRETLRSQLLRARGRGRGAPCPEEAFTSLLEAPPPVTRGQSVAWNPYHSLMLSSFCRRSPLSQVSDRAIRGSPWLCFVPEEPQSGNGACCRRGTFCCFLKETLGLLGTIRPRLQKEWDFREDVNLFVVVVVKIFSQPSSR